MDQEDQRAQDAEATGVRSSRPTSARAGEQSQEPSVERVQTEVECVVPQRVPPKGPPKARVHHHDRRSVEVGVAAGPSAGQLLGEKGAQIREIADPRFGDVHQTVFVGESVVEHVVETEEREQRRAEEGQRPENPVSFHLRQVCSSGRDANRSRASGLARASRFSTG